MFGFDEGKPAVNAGDLIKDGSEATFMQDVVEESKTVPVIVDFWAPWCGPCKTLGPALEAAVLAAKGRVKMVKLDVDQNQMIASQLRIQSVPTVYAFWQGQPVDGFQGAQSGSEITKFVERVAAHAGDGGLGEALEAAEAMLVEGAFEDAAETFAAIFEEEPANAVAFAGVARSYLALGDLDRVEGFLASATPEIVKTKEWEGAKAQLELARQAANAGPVTDLRAAVAASPDDQQLRLDLATALHASGEVEAAVDELLEMFRKDRDWNDGAAKAQLFTIFDALKPQDPIVLKGRRKLSSIIFS